MLLNMLQSGEAVLPIISASAFRRLKQEDQNQPGLAQATQTKEKSHNA